MSRQFALKSYTGGLLYTKRHITLDLGDQLVEDGRAYRYVERDGTIWFCLAAPANASAEVKRQRAESIRCAAEQAERSCAVLSRSEVEAAVGLRGRSRTAGLNDEQRAARVKKGWQAEDLVERARAKLECFRPGRLQAATEVAAS